MRSSISSFDYEYATLNRNEGLIGNIKILLAGVLIFGSVVLVYNRMVGLFEEAIGGGLNARALTMINYLPNLTKVDEHRKTVMVFGSSMVQYGFLPPLFDREMEKRGII
jgi:hypothetical protein